jgi:hypothetical protein
VDATHGRPAKGPRASQLLFAALAAGDAETVTIDRLIAALNRRAFGFVLLLVALINCVPLPPGISTLMGVPVFLVGMQLLLGWRQPWLPAFVRKRELPRAALMAALRRLEPWLAPVERLCRPRLPRVAAFMTPRPIGAVVVALSIYIMVPLVFTNIPPALAAAFIAIGLIEEDGLMLALGVPAAAIALTVSTVLAGGALAALYLGISRLIGL